MEAGIMVPSGNGAEYAGWDGLRAWDRALELAEVVERLGFAYIWVGDHLQSVFDPWDAPQLEAFTLLTAMAGRTERVRLGVGVTCAGFRSPSVTAKMTMTLDLASRGRADLSIGAGWHEPEWRGHGYGFPAIGDRLDLVEESLEIISRMLRPGRVTWEGQHFQVQDAVAEPKGAGERIPIVVGGNGPKRTYRLAARFADELNLESQPLERIVESLPIVHQRCEEIDRDPASLDVSIYYLWDGPTGQERVEQLQRMDELGLVRVYCLFTGASESNEPLESFAEDCRAAGVRMSA